MDKRSQIVNDMNKISGRLLPLWEKNYQFLASQADQLSLKLDNEKQKTIYSLFKKSLMTFKAIGILCRKELSLDACILARSLIETSIRITQLVNDDDQFERYKAYAKISHLKSMKLLSEYPISKDKHLNDLAEKIINDYEKEVKEINKIYHFGIGWSNKGLKKSAEENSLDFLYSQYNEFSNIAHSSIHNFYLTPETMDKSVAYSTGNMAFTIIFRALKKATSVTFSKEIERQIKDLDRFIKSKSE